jgi:hypothetical protein
MRLNVSLQENGSTFPNVSFQENGDTFPNVMRDVQVINGDPSGDYAPIDSPAFTGTPTAPTPLVDSSNDQLATTSFVMRAINNAHMGYGNIVIFSVAEVTS